MGKKWQILICSFSVLTFVCSVITIFLLSRIEKTHEEINTNNIVSKNKAQKTTITYYTNNQIYLENQYSKVEKKFSITNTDSNTLKYKIEWQNVNNKLSDTDIGTYTVSCSNGEKITKNIPQNNETIIEGLELKNNQTNNCTISISTNNEIALNDQISSPIFEGIYRVVVDKEVQS